MLETRSEIHAEPDGEGGGVGEGRGVVQGRLRENRLVAEVRQGLHGDGGEGW